MRNIIAALVVATLLTTIGLQVTQAARINPPPTAAEFTSNQQQDWINSSPLTLADLKGKVVLLDFWTFGCWNCYRSFPWLNAMEQRLAGEDFTVIGIHSPEFEHEKDYDRIKAKVKEFELHHPIMVDNNMAYWRAMHNRYWPAYYLIDKQGKIRKVYIGETHEGDARAIKIEAHIRQLLAEK